MSFLFVTPPMNIQRHRNEFISEEDEIFPDEDLMKPKIVFNQEIKLILRAVHKLQQLQVMMVRG